jgi:hypothetical protein
MGTALGLRDGEQLAELNMEVVELEIVDVLAEILDEVLDNVLESEDEINGLKVGELEIDEVLE